MAGANPGRVAQIAIAVQDLERAKSFYGDVLGLKHLFDAPPGLSFFQCGETRLMLSRPEGPETAGNSILYYGVEDVDSAYRAMQAQGVEFDEAPRCIAQVEGRDIWLAVCRDSEGNLLGLISG
ncbi:MAG TPA: VOC family protein [Allosphingosinicella sp.]|nr:VOC family protein [Allosphingosinicella sp.]